MWLSAWLDIAVTEGHAEADSLLAFLGPGCLEVRTAHTTERSALAHLHTPASVPTARRYGHICAVVTLAGALCDFVDARTVSVSAASARSPVAQHDIVLSLAR